MDLKSALSAWGVHDTLEAAQHAFFMCTGTADDQLDALFASIFTEAVVNEWRKSRGQA